SHPHFGQSWNPYSYVRNSPLNFVDPSGFDEEGTGNGAGWTTGTYTPASGPSGTFPIAPVVGDPMSGTPPTVAPPSATPEPDWDPSWAKKDAAQDGIPQGGAPGASQAEREGSPFGPGGMGTMETQRTDVAVGLARGSVDVLDSVLDDVIGDISG